MSTEIDFDKNIIRNINNVPACQILLERMLNNTELADVTLVAGVDGVRYDFFLFCKYSAKKTEKCNMKNLIHIFH